MAAASVRHDWPFRAPVDTWHEHVAVAVDHLGNAKVVWPQCDGLIWPQNGGSTRGSHSNAHSSVELHLPKARLRAGISAIGSFANKCCGTPDRHRTTNARLDQLDLDLDDQLTLAG